MNSEVGPRRPPKYLTIKRRIRERIASGEYGGRRPVPPERSLASEMKAAPMTVRRAIEELVDEGVLVRQRGRGKGTFVRATRGVPHAPRSRDAGLSRIAVLHRESAASLRTSPVYFMIFMEVQAECARNGVGLEFVPVAEPAGHASILRAAADSGAQALMVLDWWRPADLVEVQAAGLPVIVPGPFQETIAVSSVGANEYQGAYAVTSRLLAMGHTRVAMVNSRKEVKTTVDRWGGWLAALTSAGVPSDGLLYRAGRSGVRSGQDFDELVDDLAAEFSRRPPPGAIFARDGAFAHASMRALARLGRSCPGDVSIACVGTFYEQTLGLPRMTAAALPDGALGRAVVRLAQDLVSGRQESPVGILLPMEVVEGESARPVADAGRGGL